ncbi:L-threonylcarbamoyladenylate synthase [Ferruginibacter yonginensis]|uniref:L-threonylcarbamoyladenylate synthase n=1 Tax=Ferruginibacter yonginensis TaxID=1310416 RepID=A0ABV8QTY6_9BACT
MNFTNDIPLCVAALQQGQTILYPTDTIWGIGCDAKNSEAVANIYALKKRDEKKSMIILLAHHTEIASYAQKPNDAVLQLMAQTNNPLTIIYPNAKNLAPNLINEDGTIAIRIVKDPFCIAMINAFGGPIVSTSANISGEATAPFFNMISNEIKLGVDYIVQHRQHDNTPATPSSIVKWNTDNSFTKIR